MRRRVILFATLASALVLLASGCGGGGGDSGGSDEGAPVREIQAEAQQTAESIVLELSDFPNGWRASAPEDTQDNSAEFREVPSGRTTPG